VRSIAGDVQLSKLQAAVREQEKTVQIVDRQLLLTKHSSMNLALVAGHKPMERRHGTKESKMLTGTSQDQQQRIVLALQGELERALETLSALKAEVAASNLASRGALQLASERGGSDLPHIKQGIKEVAARLMMLEHAQERVRAAYKAEQEQHGALVAETEALQEQLAEQLKTTHELNRQQQLLELRKGGQDSALAAEMNGLAREIAVLESENQAVRQRAFNAGTVRVEARQLESRKAELLERNEGLCADRDSTSAAIARQEEAVARAQRGDSGSVEALRAAVAAVEDKGRALQRKSDELREQLAALVGQDGSHAFGSSFGSSFSRGVMDTGDHGPGTAGRELERQARRLRMENAADVREMRKMEQVAALQARLTAEQEQLEAELDAEIKRMQETHARNSRRLQAALANLSVSNDRLRAKLAAVRAPPTGHQHAGVRQLATRAAEPPALVAGAPVSEGSWEVRRTTVRVEVDSLVLLAHAKPELSEGEPSTMMVLDFFMHDSQHSAPALGLAPDTRLVRDFDVVVDHLLLHFLASDALRVQVLRVVGMEAATLGATKVNLKSLVDPAAPADSLVLHRVELREDADEPAATLLGHFNLTVKVATSLAEPARQYAAQAALQRVADPRSTDGGGVGKLEVEEPRFQRRLGSTYMLHVEVNGVSGLRGGSKSSAGRAVFAMFQLLDSEVSETEVVKTDSAGGARFTGGQTSVAIPATAEWDKRLLAQRLEVCVFDEDEDGAPGGGYVGVARLLLAPLLSHRTVRSVEPLYGFDDLLAGYVTIRAQWLPEPVADAPATGPGLAQGAAMLGNSVPNAELARDLWGVRVWIEGLGLENGVAGYGAAFEQLLVAAAGSDFEALSEAAFQAALAGQSRLAQQLGGTQQQRLLALFAWMTRARPAHDKAVHKSDWVAALRDATRPVAASRDGGAGDFIENEEDEGEELLPRQA
jgi:hypothetical protein